jgi:bacterioferritin-associated ferredoxin
MYICVCKGITDKELEEQYLLHQGNTHQILKALGVGSECGICLTEAIDHLNQNQANFQQHKPSQKPSS